MSALDCWHCIFNKGISMENTDDFIPDNARSIIVKIITNNILSPREKTALVHMLVRFMSDKNKVIWVERYSNSLQSLFLWASTCNTFGIEIKAIELFSYGHNCMSKSVNKEEIKYWTKRGHGFVDRYIEENV